ncbi:uncharacterized protein YgbK (DUF1537 family) [Mycobacterium frederiksbergense]|uniref:3-oxo-tetronate kinase n=1 Tax=Mycolicibacterium frederiksbergense TaxID=117567 RepID=A0ABT6L1Q5_9MYCO|nr:3-oxo-tetronate kinase [Mycolicibacterium frederiksbergense]MDH6196848.1 uncharacterized protein YgbK (DUF1537 family) [Mycolicibacterium frederiksbergense]
MIGILADDVTGATDVAAAVRRCGARTLLAFTAELDDFRADTDVVVIGLKTRTLPVTQAVQQSLAALETLQRIGADRFYLKYCSTFDSTAQGNIGPITDAIADRLGSGLVVTTPSAPDHGRTVYCGHLFVDDTPLDETHMREHPLTPMTDSSVVRLLQAQTSHPVGLLALSTVRSGTRAVRRAMEAAERNGIRHLVADATERADLETIAAALSDAELVGGSAGLAEMITSRNEHSDGSADFDVDTLAAGAIIAGSCSARTLSQIAAFIAAGGRHYRLDTSLSREPELLAEAALRWFDGQPARPVLIHSSQSVDQRHQDSIVSEVYEAAAGLIARGLLDRSVKKFLVAGGETSGAVIAALDIRATTVGAEAAPGVPWIRDTARGIDLILKSGNFGGPTFFTDTFPPGAQG